MLLVCQGSVVHLDSLACIEKLEDCKGLMQTSVTIDIGASIRLMRLSSRKTSFTFISCTTEFEKEIWSSSNP